MTTIGYAPVVLPSRGLLYNGKLPDGTVQVRKLTVGDEIILQSGAGGVEMISQLINACVKLPQGMTHGELLTADRLAILIGIRVFTHGQKYSYTYRCQHCGAAQKADCNLGSDIKEKPIDPSVTEPVDVHLQDADQTVGLRFLRGKDEDAVSKVAKRQSLQSNDVGDPSIITRMALQLVTIDGKEAGDLTERERFIKNMTLPDGQDMRKALDDKEPGIDLSVFPECKACGGVNEISLPFGLEFFRPARRQS
jgi:hypothetical protein